MTNRSLNKTKRVLLGVFAVAIVSLATANLGLAMNGRKAGEYNENSSDGCKTDIVHIQGDNCEIHTFMNCAVGDGFICESGYFIYNECTGQSWGYMSGIIICD